MSQRLDNVNVHQRALRAAERTSPNGHMQEILDGDKPSRTGLWAWIQRRFEFPKGEFAFVTSHGDKITLPMPVIGALVALFMWVAGGTIGFAYFMGRMSSGVETLNSSFTQYQIRTESEKKAMQEKIDLQQMYIQNDRERLARLEATKANKTN